MTQDLYYVSIQEGEFITIKPNFAGEVVLSQPVTDLLLSQPVTELSDEPCKNITYFE